MKEVEILIIGGGPAGMCAAISAAEAGANVMLVERDRSLGGQLVKQTHMFFGSEKQYASNRGIDITNILLDKLKNFDNIIVKLDTTVLGIYEDGIVTLEENDKYLKIKPKSIVVSTGASEKTLAFPNNDLPGIYGAGAVQTLMNVYGIKPGNKVLMVGSGNIGLIVSYQLMQAGIKVVGIVEASPNIGGYLVHASKVRRLGIPIYTQHTIKEAFGDDYLVGATICKLDNDWNQIPGTEIEIDIDVMCIAIGLSPLSELLWQAGCQMKFLNELGGFVPLRNENLKTTVDGIYVAGDIGGIEEASSAMVEGYLAGISTSFALGYFSKNMENKRLDYMQQLNSLRSGPTGAKIRKGLSHLLINVETTALK
ncbi:NAD(P)/FAD-dependent oxidoreductase [Alkaliphilus sp. MSJ-5]|uniref:NAD(P)/FAD-dependent oxidoreductase n=1 Tax=Alkaliphilus flagellatus TaxID=2841507 RepID=A0ABS6G4T9_9FIRM|nr:NAD(P)/FAD-dependent oxidoreductase [Alkaliphilus flagellatus]MBU5677482.1 NAD(P)/FAD-dependent oxidoreductase [Alkaliphilus flagellatus]